MTFAPFDCGQRTPCPNALRWRSGSDFDPGRCPSLSASEGHPREGAAMCRKPLLAAFLAVLPGLAAAQSGPPAKDDLLPPGAVARLGRARCVFFLPDGQYVFSVGDDQRIHLWESASGKQIRRVDLPHGTCGYQLSPDGRYA